MKHKWLENVPSHGTGRNKTIEFWKKVLAECRSAGLIEEHARAIPNKNTVFAAVVLATTGETWLEDDSSVLFARLVASPVRLGRTTPDDALYNRLSRERVKLAGRLPPYLVCSNATLREIALREPTTDAELQAIAGMGGVKIKKYGSAILQCVRDARRASSLS